ncbi:hypothetical protein [Bradyrhizobium liaoningense]|uniref:hypothetical protein n=1 Tax=Bradyrhizobium liaoningense TaxID=43992 RepID=UPI001BAAFE6E|nr:hypothetical protein [Bradyrhizobium liaoningense]MBR0855510.1 hypothetical protein [Bradyrhizobium liaoningense]
MSRHEITARDPAHKIIVGWDHPLQTFFIQVIDREQEAIGSDDKFVAWRGCSLREIYEVDQLVRILGRYALVPSELPGILYGDKDEGR